LHQQGNLTLQAEVAVRTAPRNEWGAYLIAGLDLTECDQVAFRSEYFDGYRISTNKEWAVDLCYNRFFCLDCGAELKLQLSPRYGQEKNTGKTEDILSIIAAVQVHF
jgi:hypothetical protein